MYYYIKDKPNFQFKYIPVALKQNMCTGLQIVLCKQQPQLLEQKACLLPEYCRKGTLYVDWSVCRSNIPSAELILDFPKQQRA